MKLFKYLAVLFICVFMFTISGHQAFAGSCASSGVGVSWNTAADWTGTCTGVGGLPATGDSVTINHPITVDVSIPSIASLTINSTLTSSNFINTGTLTINASGTLIANSNTITLTGTSGTLFTLVPGGTYTPGTAQVLVVGNGDATLNSGSPTFASLTISGSGTKTLGAPVTVTGALAIAVGNLDTSTSNYALSAASLSITTGTSIIANGSTINITGTSGVLMSTGSSGVGITYGTSTFNFSGNGNATIGTGTQMNFYNLTSSGTGTKTIGAGGIVIRPGGTLSVTNGTFDPGSGGILSVGSTTLSVTNATVNAITAFEVDFPFTSRILGVGSTVDYNEGSPQTVYQGVTYYNLKISGSFTKSLSGVTTVTNQVTVASGTFSTAGQTLNARSIVMEGGTFTPGAATVNLTGTGVDLITIIGGSITPATSTFAMTGNGDANLLSASSGQTFYNITSSGTGTKSVGGTVNITAGGTLSITAGTFNPGSLAISASNTNNTLSVTNATINVGRSTFSSTYSDFTTKTLGVGSTVNYNRAGTQTIDNSFAYYNLSITGGSREVDFPTTGTTTVTNAFTANGTVGNSLNLFSPTPGVRWSFVPSGSALVSYVSVRDGACGVGAVSWIVQSFLTDLGNNDSCWVPAVSATVQTNTSGGGLLGLLLARTQVRAPAANPLTSANKDNKNMFTRTLKFGSKGADVTELQKILVKDGQLVMKNEGDYGYFGKLTLAALKAFQVKHGVVSAGGPGYGQFGPKTIAVINSL